MARLEDYLNQEMLDKLRGMQQQAPDQMAAAIPTPGPTPLPVAPTATQGMGPLANADQYKPSAQVPARVPAEETDEEPESSETDRQDVLKNVFAGSSPKVDTSNVLAPGKGFTENTVENLKKAQDQANQDRQVANLVQGLNTVTSGVIGKRHNTDAPDVSASNKGWDKYAEAGAEGVKQFKERGDQEKNDPNSSASASMREFAKPMMAKLGIKLPDNVSFAQMEKISPLMVKMFDAKEATDARRDLLKDRALDRAASRGQKTNEKEEKAYSELRTKAETFRGNPAAQQASRDTLSASKALALVKTKDPNKLTTQDLNLLAGELAKIATGGVPTEHGIQALMPNNLNTKFAELQNFILSKPSDARAAEYIKRNMHYLDDMSKTAQKVLDSYHNNMYKGYKGRISSDHQKEFLSDYPGVGTLQNPTTETAPPSSNEERRMTKDGRTAIFDKNTKQFIKYE